MNTPTPILHQNWKNLLFLHWEVSKEVIQSTLPVGLRVDTYQNKAYLGIVAFEMQKLRLHNFMTFPGISDFNELNLRTYVKDEAGNDGVWFYSLEAASPVSVWIANTFFSLPYRNADISKEQHGDEFRYQAMAQRDATKEDMQFQFKACSDNDVSMTPSGSLEHFLVERYRLFTVKNRSDILISGKIRHKPYQIGEVELSNYSGGLFRLNGFEVPQTPPISALFSPGVDVDLFALKKA